MKQGGKRRLVIPPELAFGVEGRPGVVPPNTWVKVEVELLSYRPGPPLPYVWPHENVEFTRTESGLLIADFVVGVGESPKLGQTIGVKYSGYFMDGALFDSSYIDGKPVIFKFVEGGLIQGWIEGILTMKPGGRRKLIVPPELAYGPRGSPPKIPPNATLEFDIELLEFW